MKKITLKNGLAIAMFVLAGSVYSQTTTPVNNLIRLISLTGNPLVTPNGTTSLAGPPISLATDDDSTITIDAAGVVTIGSDYTPTASLPTSGTVNTTGTVLITGARDKTFSIRLSAGSVVDQTVGASYGAITTAGGINRSSDGGLGVTSTGASSGIDNGEGVNFGLDLTNIPSTLAVEITAVYLSTFGASETCVAVNRQDTSKSTNLPGFTGNSGRKDISTLGISIPGGTVDLDAVSFFSLNAASSFRITSIEIKIVEIPQGTLNAVDNLIRLNSLTGNQTITPNGTTSIQSPLNLVTLDDSNISVDASGVVTVESDYNPKAAQPIAGTTNTTGTVQIAGAKSKTFSIRLSAGAVMNQTPGVPEFGAITTTGGIQRALDGGIGVTTTGGSAGIDNGKGLNFGLNLSNLPSTVSVEITAVYVSTFGLAESCKIVNRQDTSKNTTVTGFETNSGRIDISSLGILIPGGTTDLDAASFISPDAASNFRITGIELKVIDTTLGVKDQTAAFSRKFMVSQNPNTEMISIEYDASAMQNISASLIDINGRIIDNKSSKNAANNTILFEGNSLKSGVYLVKISNETNSFTKKIIKK
jgi:Secretion system C-terminal sorting domain